LRGSLYTSENECRRPFSISLRILKKKDFSLSSSLKRSLFSVIFIHSVLHLLVYTNIRNHWSPRISLRAELPVHSEQTLVPNIPGILSAVHPKEKIDNNPYHMLNGHLLSFTSSLFDLKMQFLQQKQWRKILRPRAVVILFFSQDMSAKGSAVNSRHGNISVFFCSRRDDLLCLQSVGRWKTFRHYRRVDQNRLSIYPLKWSPSPNCFSGINGRLNCHQVIPLNFE
jgi:hypothetical protein